MARIFDRRSQRTLGVVDDAELRVLVDLLQQPAVEEERPLLDDGVIERLVETGASDNLRLIVRQILDGGDALDIGWEA